MFSIGILFSTAVLFLTPPQIEFSPEKLRVSFDASVLAGVPDAERSKKLAVRVGGEEVENGIAILGTWTFESATAAVFVPRFPFEAGTAYQLDLNGYIAIMEMPKPQAVAAQVTAIYPSADSLPENLLRMYIHFDRPMRPGEAFSHLKLLDEKGRPIAKPFLELSEELWSPDMKRFTLLLDPGRVKRQLKPREELGPVLEAGHSYQLVVEAGWKTADGSVLKAESRKKFAAGPSGETALKCSDWSVKPPPANSREPLSIEFDRPLDHALLERVIRVEDTAKQGVAGQIGIAKADRQWLLTPGNPWKPGRYKIAIEAVLEDVCGNRIDRAFETRLGESRPTVAKKSYIDFEVIK